MLRVLYCAIAFSMAGTPVLSNAPGESGPYKFRDANQRQVQSNLQRARLEKRGAFGVGSAAGLGIEQIGNYIQVIGDNNVVSDPEQNNSGDQQQTGGDNSPIAGDDNNFLNVGN